MLKILFFLLLLINGGLYAFQQGYLDTLLPANHEPTRLAQQLHADQLTLVPESATKPKTPPANTSTSAPDHPSDAAGLEKIVARIDQGSNQDSGIMACTEIGNFDAIEAKRFETRLTALSLGERVKRLPVPAPLPDTARHIVYIPPLGSKEAAEKKAGELKRFGVQDFFIIQDNSPLQWGISLGVFKTEEAARKQLADLNKKGVHSARVGDHGTAANKFAFQLRALDTAGKSGLDKIKADFPHQETRACTPAP